MGVRTAFFASGMEARRGKTRIAGLQRSRQPGPAGRRHPAARHSVATGRRDAAALGRILQYCLSSFRASRMERSRQILMLPFDAFGTRDLPGSKPERAGVEAGSEAGNNENQTTVAMALRLSIAVFISAYKSASTVPASISTTNAKRTDCFSGSFMVFVFHHPATG